MSTDQDKKTVRARVWGTKNIYIHNDLSNVSFNFHKRVIERHQAGDHEGIGFDRMSCLVFEAFAFEAYLNFFGLKLVPDWEAKRRVWMRFADKRDLIFKVLNVPYDPQKRPYSSLDSLIDFRNTLAHGKPIVGEYDEIRDVPQDDLERPYALDAEWEAYCAHDNTLMIYSDIEEILNMLRSASGIDAFNMMTTGFGGISLAE